MRFLFIICLCFSVSSFSQSRLKKAKENLSQKTLNTASYTNTSAESNPEKNTFAEFLFVNLIAKPIFRCGKSLLVGKKEVRVFNPIPFDNNNGEYVNLGEKENYRVNLLQASMSYSSGKYRIKGLHADLEYRFSDIIGLTAKHSHFYEKKFGETENLNLSGLTFNYYRIREGFITAWWSLGISNLANNVNSVGLRYGIATRVFVKKPISILLSWQQDFINSKTINESKINIDYHLKKLSLFVGYNHYNFATVKTPSVSIGLRYKFR